MSKLLRHHSRGLHDTHSSLSASLESLPSPDSPKFASVMANLPSQHSGFLEYSDTSLAHSPGGASGFSAYRDTSHRQQHPNSRASPESDHSASASRWFNRTPYLPRRTMSPPSHHASVSRGGSVEDPVSLAARIPLPAGASLSVSPERERSVSPPEGSAQGLASPAPDPSDPGAPAAPELGPDSPAPANYFRFAMQGEVMHKTDAIEAFCDFFGGLFRVVGQRFRNKTQTFLTISMVVIGFFIFQVVRTAPQSLPAPDIVQAAELAKSFEPMMYYSQNSVEQVKDMQETGVAVQDLSESVKLSNFTSAPVIVDELDHLSGTLRAISHELTNFFTYMDNDIDTILSTMDWARRELAALPTPSNFAPGVVKRNAQDFLSRQGILANASTGLPNAAGRLVAFIFGRTAAETQRATQQIAFTQMLNTFEDTVTQEIMLTSTLMALFQAAENQFKNAQRSIGREMDNQERGQEDALASLWLRTVGRQRAKLQKFERNMALLANVAAHMRANEKLVRRYNNQLVHFQGTLSQLRKRLIGQLLKGNEESYVSLADQVRKLEDIWTGLRSTRDARRDDYFQQLYDNSASRKIHGDRVRKPVEIGNGPGS